MEAFDATAPKAVDFENAEAQSGEYFGAEEAPFGCTEQSPLLEILAASNDSKLFCKETGDARTAALNARSDTGNCIATATDRWREKSGEKEIPTRGPRSRTHSPLYFVQELWLLVRPRQSQRLGGLAPIEAAAWLWQHGSSVS